MSAGNELEINGLIQRNPTPELFAEIRQNKLTGSLRLSSENHKIVLYFEDGEIVFAASNAREHRLFEILTESDLITDQHLALTQDFTNDFQLSYALQKEGVFSKEAMKDHVARQIKDIFCSALNWDEGSWEFSPLARVKEDLRFKIEVGEELFGFSDSVAENVLLARFRSFAETFRLAPGSDGNNPPIAMAPHEAFVYSRLGQDPLSIDDLMSISGITSNQVLPILYKLWLGGFILRENWNSAFRSNTLTKIRDANISLKQAARSVADEELEREEEEKKAEEEEKKRLEEEERRQKAEERASARDRAEESKYLDVELTVDEFLDLVANAPTFYHMLGVKPDAELATIKRAYFAFARRFHPDVFHREVDEVQHRRIQQAFTEIAHGYETLRDDESREMYDFKLRKVLEALDEESVEDLSSFTRDDVAAQSRSSQARSIFESGMEALNKDDYAEATSMFGKVIQLQPDVAEYHAFYGKALSSEKKDQHKAEKALQNAVRLEPDNSRFRLMLAELYVEIGLPMRATSELNRLLEREPQHRAALELLSRLNSD